LKCLSKILHPEESSEHYHSLGLSQSLFDEARPEAFFSIEAKESGYQQAELRAVATLGASFMRRFLESNSKSKLEFIINSVGRRSNDLEDALENSFPSREFFSLKPNPDRWDALITFQGDSGSQPNKAWLWAKENNPSLVDDFYARGHDDLIAWGYVFWDAGRLRKMGVIENPCPKMRFIAGPPLRLRPYRHATLSAEQRLIEMGFV
jgi:hypothetical protein